VLRWHVRTLVERCRRKTTWFPATVTLRTSRLAVARYRTAPSYVPARLLAEVGERVVFDPASRPIDVGRTQRLFSGATRRAVGVSDRTCLHDYCDQR